MIGTVVESPGLVGPSGASEPPAALSVCLTLRVDIGVYFDTRSVASSSALLMFTSRHECGPPRPLRRVPVEVPVGRTHASINPMQSFLGLRSPPRPGPAPPPSRAL